MLRLYSLKTCNTPSRKWDPVPDVVELAIKPPMKPKNFALSASVRVLPQLLTQELSADRMSIFGAQGTV